MSETFIDGKKVYFEVRGTGEPVLFLNGALMSTESWGQHAEAFSQRYMLILMDFFGQGKSEIVIQGYTQDLQVEAVKAVLDALSLSQAHIVATSYGAQVALSFVLKYQERVKSLVLQGVKSYFDDPHSSALCESWIDIAKQCDPDKLWDAIVPRAYGPEFYNKHITILNERKALFRSVLSARPREWFVGWAQLIRSFLTFNVKDRLGEIKVPTLIIGGELDTLVPLNFHREVHEGISGSGYIVVQGSAHCPYVAHPKEFQYVVLGFLEAQRRFETQTAEGGRRD